MEKAGLRILAAALLTAGATAGCSGVSAKVTSWIPAWPHKQEQGLSWATPDMSKAYGSNRVNAERGGVIEPRQEMPKPEPEGKIARMTSAITGSKAVKSVTSVFRRPTQPAQETVAQSEPSPDRSVAGATIYVSLAQVQEQQGNVAAAAEAYERALHEDSSNLQALLGYARLKDRQGDFARATQLYQLAARMHPQEATVFNDLALCLSRQGKSVEAEQALQQAVRLKPDRKLYRNNLAKLQVDLGRPQQALEQLLAVHPPAVAHYNLGYLLQQRQQPALAREHFAQALNLDPNLADARQWLAMIDNQQMAGAQQRPAPHHEAYAPYAPPAQPPMQPRTSMDPEFYLPSRY